MIRFVDQDPTGKDGRKAYGAACETCRRAKRKCTHLNGNGEDYSISRMAKDGRETILTPNSTPSIEPTLKPIATTTESAYEVPEAGSSPFALPQAEVGINRSNRDAKRQRDDSLEIPNKRSSNHKTTAQRNSPGPTPSDHGHTTLPPIGLQSTSTTGLRGGCKTAERDSTSVDRQEYQDFRFIGDLNPDGALLVASSPSATGATLKSNNIGVWTKDDGTAASTSQDRQSHDSSSNNVLSTYNPALTRHILPFLEESSLSSIPNDLDFGGIWGIYLHNFHPIFNILDYTGVKGEDGLSLISRSTPYGRILVQGMCLAATLHPDAKRCCRLNGGALLSPRIFADEVALSMRTTLDLGLITHKPTLLKALFLLSFYTQYIQGDLPSQWSSRLVHLAHTMGIHLASNEEGNWVFLDIWALDRLNAAFHGRPVLLHERDSDLNIQVMINDIGPAWPARRLFLQVVMLLDGVIGLYRPATAQNYPKIAFEFPSFEELVLNTGGTRGDNYMLATIEIFYHAVSILSSRSSLPGGIKGVPTVSMRQLFSAEKILEILEESDEQIVLFPFVPYAASLSLGVFYRDLRHNKLRTHQARAKSWLQGGCAALVKLQAHFPPLTRTLGTVSRLLLEIDRVLLSDAAQRGSRRLRKNRTSDSPATPQIHCSDRETSSEGLTGGMPKDIPDRSEAPPSSQFDGMRLDTTIFDLYPDFDIFSHLDPSLDLDTIDNLFQIDGYPSLPTTLHSL